MGKTKIKTIDDSQAESSMKSEKKKEEKNRAAESEHDTAVQNESGQKFQVEGQGVMASGALIPDKQNKRIKTATPKQGKKTRSKKYQEVKKLVDPNQKYPLLEAIELAQKTSYSKFEGTLEAHINTTAKNLSGQVIHATVGKTNQPKEEIAVNLKAFISTTGKAKIQKITLSPTMGPGIKIDLHSI